MAAAARPFDFSAFDAPAPLTPTPVASEPEPATSYTQAELDEAVAQARKDAVKSIAAREALNQTALLESISSRLTETTVAEIDRVAEHIDMLTDVAETIVKEFCITSAAAQQSEAALAMVDRFLRATDDAAGATIVLPAKTAKRGLARIKKAIAERAGDQVTVTTDAALSPGEIRLEWRGGAMARNHDDINAQIEAIFAATKVSRSGRSTKKETNS